MGISGIGPGSLLLILAIVLLIFGTKRLKNLGGDLGGAIKGFKKAMSDEETSGKADETQKEQLDDAEASKAKQNKVSEKQK